MAAQSLHDIYTRQTTYLLHWLINTSNGIIESREDGYFDMRVNTTGETTVDDIPKVARLVAENLNSSEIPDLAIYLFDAVIQDRTTIHKAWVRFEKSTEEPDPELVESNKKHKYFIDQLLKAFTALDGPSRLSEQKACNAARPGQDDLNELVRFTNRFSALSINGDSRSDSGQSGAEYASRQASRPASTKGRQKSKGQRKKTRKEKGKWRKGDSQEKKKQLPQEDAAAKPCHNEIPLESCRIIGDVDIAYNMANAWINVVDKGLHSVVAAGVSHLAVAMVKQSEAALAVDFPGRENYQTVMGTLTGGNPDKCRVSLRITGAELDIRERAMVYIFRDLVDFLVDYSSYPHGRPTMRMLAEIESWDPRFDLQRARPAQRNEQQLFGLKEFAATVAFLAENAPANDIGRNIMPRHVSQLQCTVDSFTISRGWFVSSRGHIMSSPKYSFHSRRDIKRWMHDQTSAIDLGRLNNIDRLKVLCEDDSAALGAAKSLENVHLEFVGQSRGADGIWEVSPFTCGAGLLEALSISYSIGLRLMDDTQECLLLMHLHNMLVVKGFLKKPIEIYAMISRWLASTCFGGAGTPNSGFSEAFLACIKTPV
ncbi:hypothetical protein PG991_012401 [Apiospora marii]|uniref:DUF6604 domain-containing protein n=1 Tax=Apiospora marii TaxID=335849 RepID=A0ABR1R9K7_9PEZI